MLVATFREVCRGGSPGRAFVLGPFLADLDWFFLVGAMVSFLVVVGTGRQAGTKVGGRCVL